MVSMKKPVTNHEAYERVWSVIKKAELAKHLNLPRQSITQWNGEIPARHVLEISVITGIPCEELLPELVAKTRDYMAVLKAASEQPKENS